MTNYNIPTEIIKQIISDYNYNETNNKQHGAKLNMSYNRNETENKNEEQNEKPYTWLGSTMSGKGFIIFVGEENPIILTGSKGLLDKFLDGKIKGVPLTRIDDKE